ncbi:hypothetical protein KCG54_10085 [Neisseria subflava]|uniref:Uncharacterized protein n=1 Tax=Neisseria subflava TaxID=28449 RepID=A0A9X9N103_NEISU|nr:hypothetical protein [Neisseria subflava]UTG69514.1 hypothetical protein KCG54_10085 [Neisseria subflava]
MSTFFQQTAQAMIAKHIDQDICKIPFPQQPKSCVWVSAVWVKMKRDILQRFLQANQ